MQGLIITESWELQRVMIVLGVENFMKLYNKLSSSTLFPLVFENAFQGTKGDDSTHAFKSAAS